MSEETNSTTIESIRSMLESEIPKLQIQNIADTISNQTGHRPVTINLIKNIKQHNVAEMIKSDVPNINKNDILKKVIELVTDGLAYPVVSGGHRRSSYKQKKSKKSRKNRKKSKRTSRR